MPRVQTFQVDGTLVHKFDVQQITDTFSKRAIIVRIEHDQYPQEVKLECVGPAKNYLDNIPVGRPVTCECELTGRSYVKKTDGTTDWFTSVKCFAILEAGSGPAPKQTTKEPVNDLPF